MALTKVSSGVVNQALTVNTLNATTVKATNMQNISGTSAVDVNKLSTNQARYTRQIITQVDTTDRTTSTTWTLGTELPTMTDFKAGSLLRIYYMYPCRNDSSSWGGLYFEPQIRFNSSTWQSCGSRGYDAVMDLSPGSISSTTNTMLIDPAASVDFTAQLRFYFKSYDGSVGLNNGNGHDINAISGTATIMSGNNGNQHYGHWIIEELAIFRGAA
jgi:hypothetical protein